MNLLCRPLVPLLAMLLGGCAHSHYSFSRHENKFADDHKIIADVTCIREEKFGYYRFGDNFLFCCVPRVRLTANFQIDRVTKGDTTNHSFSIVNAVGKDTKYSVDRVFGIDKLEPNTTWRVGIGRIVDGETRSIEFLYPTNALHR